MNIEIKDILTVLEKDNAFHIAQTSIYVQDGNIASIGTKPDGFIPEKTIDGQDKLAIPGLVNCHTHAYMSIFRNLADDKPFDEWLFRSVMPLEDKMNGNDAYWGSLLGYAEMLKTGTTACVDMHMFVDDCAKAVADIGIRGVLTRGLVGFGREDEGGIRRINELKADMECYAQHPRISFMVAPHAIYTTDAEYLALCTETAKALSLPIHIHLSETKNEVDTAYEKYGMSPVAYLEKIGLLDEHTIAAHCVHLSEADIEVLKAKQTYVASNPKSNMKLANGFAPIPALMENSIAVCLGTDGAACNNTLNMFSEMNTLSLIHKGTTCEPKVVSAAETFALATKTGAEAAKLNAGVLAAGKKADIVLLDLNRPQFTPRHNLLSALVYSANGSEVHTVIVEGDVVVENGRLTKIDEEEIYAKANEVLQALKAR